MLFKKAKNQLTNDTTQRLIYSAGLALWTFGLWGAITEHPFAASSVEVNYIALYLIPALLLFLQIIMNNQILWGLIVGLMAVDYVAALYLTIAEAIERNGDHVKAIPWNVKDVFILLFVFAVSFIACWITYRIKPGRLI